MKRIKIYYQIFKLKQNLRGSVNNWAAIMRRAAIDGANKGTKRLIYFRFENEIIAINRKIGALKTELRGLKKSRKEAKK